MSAQPMARAISPEMALEEVLASFPVRIRQRGINRYYVLYRFLVKRLAPHWDNLAGGHVCDLGAGAGIMPLVMARLGFAVSAVDNWREYTDDNDMGDARDFFPRFERFGVTPITADVCDVPLAAGSQDIVSAYAVLEHMPRPNRLMDEIRRLLKPAGLAIITVPNCCNLRNRLVHLLGKSPHPDPWDVFYADQFYGHYRELTPNETRRIFEHWGFQVLELTLSEASHNNTRLGDQAWTPGWRPVMTAANLARGLYLGLAVLVPSFRYDILCVARS